MVDDSNQQNGEDKGKLSFMLVYKGVDTESPIERQSIARQLAYELQVPVEQINETMQWIGSPLFTHLSQHEALKLSREFAGMGVHVEVRMDKD